MAVNSFMVFPAEGSPGMKKLVQGSSRLNAWFSLKSGSFFACRYHPVSAHNETITLARVFHELRSQQVIHETSGLGEGLLWVCIQT